jgi:hypothetical protein
LPLTTLRTIDLGGKKKTGPLSSIFWPEMRVFFEVNSAPKYVQHAEVGPLTGHQQVHRLRCYRLI